MAKDMTTSVSFMMVSELITHAVFEISGTVVAANEVLIHKENFKKFSAYLEKTTFILKALSKRNIDDYSESLRNALEILNQEVKVSKHLVLECCNRNKVYLLINCRKIVKRLEDCTKEISRALSLIPLASLDVSSGLNNQISELCENMLNAEYRAAMAEEEILEKIELGIQEGNRDRSYANQLLACIAEAVGISTEKCTLRKEFEEFKSDIENAKLRKDMADALQMEQIIALLGKADAATSHQEKQQKYFEKRDSLGRKTLEPLQSFYCPILHDVMVDPVETSSGKTFERSAIQKWFAEGNNHCPLTMMALDTSVLQPNKALRQSIHEWKERNTIIIISSIKTKLQSNEEQDVLKSLDKLQDLCMERDIHREWVAIEDYMPVLAGLLGSKNCEIRKNSLVILFMLAKDNEGNKESIAKVDNALQSIVHSIARKIGEGKLALELLLELSRNNIVRDLIGIVQGCIFLLVTMLNSDDTQASKNAQELLENLSLHDHNVIQMAKENYIKPLLRNLLSGSESTKIDMAETLSEIELTDQNKLYVIQNGALDPLLQLLKNDRIEIKKVAAKALLHLSILPQNGLHMIREGVVGPLFELLYRQSSQTPTLREWVAATIMNLAKSTTVQKADEEQVTFLESEEDIFKLFSLISLTGSDIQTSILKAFYAMCQSPSGLDIRMKLSQLSAVRVLVQLCELDNKVVRANAVKLFFCLTEASDDSSFSEHVGQKCIENLLRIIETTNDVEEMGAAMGIVSKLPKDPQVTQWLLDSGALETIFACLTDGNRHTPPNGQVTGNAVQAICRFTVSTTLEWQKMVAEAGIIPVLVQLLISGTALVKQNAAISIKQFSESSNDLSKPIKKHSVFGCCFAAHEIGCPAHLGICTVESTFCLLEANALEPLVRMLADEHPETCEASLDALLTLIHGDRLRNGTKVLANANAIALMIKLLSLPSDRLQEKTLEALERIFQLDEIRERYKSSATMHLVEIAQRKDSRLKSLAAKVLAQLGVLDKQSSYF
ncbi:RING-type E3 ubiquitin transferase [Quillaja saponaria]|uniref:RING-type E3 ubiquitin transferase n=1 Tax=Quillaja saponaria TaxID=32244 RepID=A0AAD7LK69_QUISA|nr:RING-type E3 ubiquitin transferase [Quillaja saponaria]